jgi:hypothetical protein
VDYTTSFTHKLTFRSAAQFRLFLSTVCLVGLASSRGYGLDHRGFIALEQCKEIQTDVLRQYLGAALAGTFEVIVFGKCNMPRDITIAIRTTIVTAMACTCLASLARFVLKNSLDIIELPSVQRKKKWSRWDVSNYNCLSRAPVLDR